MESERRLRVRVIVPNMLTKEKEVTHLIGPSSPITLTKKLRGGSLKERSDKLRNPNLLAIRLPRAKSLFAILMRRKEKPKGNSLRNIILLKEEGWQTIM